MQLTPAVRKATLTAHLLSSLGWVGALLVFLAHAVASWAAVDAQAARAAALAMDVAAWFVILPLAIATLVTGLIQALGTPWGLWRHYWVIFKLVFTLVATSVLLAKLGPIAHLSEAASSPRFGLSDSMDLRLSLLVHALGGLAVLFAAVLLAVFKPHGRTRSPGDLSPELAPRWVRAASWATGVLLLLVILMVISGKHGPQVHAEPTGPNLAGCMDVHEPRQAQQEPAQRRSGKLVTCDVSS